MPLVPSPQTLSTNLHQRKRPNRPLTHPHKNTSAHRHLRRLQLGRQRASSAKLRRLHTRLRRRGKCGPVLDGADDELLQQAGVPAGR